MSEKFVELSSLYLPKNKQKPEVKPENKNTSDCKLYQNITYATSKLYRVTTKVKKKKKKKNGKSKYPTQSIDLSKKKTDL